MDFFESLQTFGFCAVTGGGLVFAAMKRKRQAKMIEDTPKSKLATAAQGHCEFEGFAWPQGAPYLDYKENPFVYYSFQLQREETQGSGKNKKRVWVTKFTFTHSKPFYLVDATGVGLVHPDNSDLNISSTKTRLWQTVDQEEQDHLLVNVMKESVPDFPPAKNIFGGFAGKYRIVETTIKIGSPLFATGDFRTSAQGIQLIKETGLTGFGAKVFDYNSRGLKRVERILDKNNDGKVTEEEARDGYVMAAKVAMAHAKKVGVAENDFELHGEMHSTADHKLILADVHEGFLLKKLKRFQNLQLVAGYALIVASVGIPVAEHQQKQNMIVQPKKKVTRQVASTDTNALPKASDLHSQCVQSQLSSCVELVRKKDYYKLSPVHVKYYNDQIDKLAK